jgi:drug/metabolite transporter (DMT)-like permease
MENRTLKSNSLLLLTAAIWGFAFVAQRMGMNHVGPFTFNGMRFALGSLALLPVLIVTERRRPHATLNRKTMVLACGITGGVLFMGASLQQMGIIYTTAGKAGFITGLYVVMVPIFGLVLKHHTDIGTWVGAVLATVGLYFLSVTEQFTIQQGDFLVLMSAFFWTVHVLIIDWLSPRANPIKIAFIQFVICSVLSFIVALFTEVIDMGRVFQAALPIIYSGALSVGIAYTLQIVAQKNAHPAHAAIILSMETVFAALGGWIVLNEILSPREISGCLLMLTGMTLSQLWGYLLHFRRKSV